MNPTLTVSTHAIAKHFGSVPAVDGVDMAVTGGVVGLLGPNGAGKTTLLRMLATVLAPDSGHARLLGLDPARAGDRLGIRRQLGYLPQEPGLYPGFSAFDLVDYVAVLKEMSDREARRHETRRVLDLVGLSDVMHRRIRTLSGGTRHRVALAAALLGSPPLLLMDEPAAGLDPEHRLRLRSILSEAGTRGTVIVATHHTAEAAALCQQVIVMLDGRLCFVGPPAALAALAEAQVWVDDTPPSIDHPGRVQSWVTSEGRIRNIGEPPPGADLVEPTIDDGYLLLTNRHTTSRSSGRRRATVVRRLGRRLATITGGR
jgi:ABC-2 type transport system ATP-binding protein